MSGSTPAPPPDPSGKPTMSSDDVRNAVRSAHPYDLAIVAAGVLTFVLSLFPYYTASIDIGLGGLGETSASVSAWHGFFGWFGALVALAVAVVLALSMLGIKLNIPTRLLAVGGFGVALLCLLLALFVIPGGDCGGVQLCEDAVDLGHGFGYWASVLVVLGGLALSVKRLGADD